jgi:hypothetical protein
MPFRRLRDETSLGDVEKVVDVLVGAGITCWLDSGTLLSVVRDGVLLASDPDIDLAMWAADEPTLDALRPRLRALGYRIRSESYNGDVFNYTLIPEPFLSNRKRVDIYLYRRLGVHAWAPAVQAKTRSGETHRLNPVRVWWFVVYLVWVLVVSRVEVTGSPWAGFFRVKTWWVPADYFSAVLLHETGLPLPVGWEAYLTLRYGDWRTPATGWSFWTDDGALRPGRPESALQVDC